MSCSKLHELCQKNSWGAPNYTTNREGGPDHNPLFSATVTVNGHTFQTAEPCKTSKGARNAAASVALKHFADTVAPLPLTASLLEAAPGAGSTQLKRSAEDDVSATIAKKLKGVQHLYKSKLQMYAHRKNLSIPTYSCDSDGQQSACRFKCKVKVGEQVFESPGYFSKIKDAENAAAQVAVLSLSSSGIEEDDSGLVKALLQQIARGSGHHLPCYETTKSGEDHMPIFVTSVKIRGETFKGEAASTKRQAEISAARVAYRALADRYSSGNAVLSSSSHKEQDLNHSPSSLKTNESANMEQDVGNEARDETGITFTTTNSIAMLKQVKSLACQYMLPLPQPTMIKGFGPSSSESAKSSPEGKQTVAAQRERVCNKTEKKQQQI